MHAKSPSMWTVHKRSCGTALHHVREWRYVHQVVRLLLRLENWSARLNKLDSEAYEQAFRATFNQVTEDHPEFIVGQTLKGIILDWSDTQQKGLENWRCNTCVYSANIYILQVHFQRSVKKVSEKVNRCHSLAHQAFTTIGYAILSAKSKEDVILLFQVLGGTEPLSTAISILPQSSVLKEYESTHKQEKWSACSNWSKWWMRPTHLGKGIIILPLSSI